MERSEEELLQEIGDYMEQNMKLGSKIWAFLNRVKLENFDGLTEEQIIHIQNMTMDDINFPEEESIMEAMEVLATPRTARTLDKLNEVRELLKFQEETYMEFMRKIAGQEYWDSFADDERVITCNESIS